jgi:3-deoxy-manno-octulosonate cytidylyltransferase (CMP-KDO synthetase)
MEVIGVIPARLSSTRLEAKVLADICGKPMIQHVWERAKEARLLDEVVIACDSEAVAERAKKFKAKCVMTSRDHACGTDRIIEVVNPLDVRVVINIQGDEPLVHPSMIDCVAQAMLDDRSLSVATIMKKITDPAVVNDPNVVKVVVDKNNFALYFSRSPIPHLAHNSEVKNPDYYKHFGLYGYTKDFLFTFKNLPVSKLERTEKLEQLRVLQEGFRIKVVETNFDTVSVDVESDLERVRQLLGAGKR